MKGFITLSIAEYQQMQNLVNNMMQDLGDNGRGQYDPSKVVDKDNKLRNAANGLRLLSNTMQVDI